MSSNFARLDWHLGIWLVLPLCVLASLWLSWNGARGDGAHRIAPGQVLKAIPALLHEPDSPVLPKPLIAGLTTVTRVALCIFFSSAAGLFVGLLFGVYRPAKFLFMPTIDFVRGLPITFVLVPLVLVMSPFEPSVPWVLASIPCTAIMIVQVSKGLEHLDSDRLCCLRTYFRGSRTQMLQHVYLPEVFAAFVVGAKLIAPYSVILIGVLEYAGAGAISPGFGSLVQKFEEHARGASAMAAVIVFGVLGLVLCGCVSALEMIFLRWQRER